MKLYKIERIDKIFVHIREYEIEAQFTHTHTHSETCNITINNQD